MSYVVFARRKRDGHKNFILIHAKKIYYFFIPAPVASNEFNAKCPALDQTQCPVFKGLTTFIRDSKKNPRSAEQNIKKINDMWNIVEKRSCIIRNRQVSFIELLIVQIVSIFLLRMAFKPNNNVMPNAIPFEIVFSVMLLALFLALAISLIETKPSYFYEVKTLRLSIILVCWFFISWYLVTISFGGPGQPPL